MDLRADITEYGTDPTSGSNSDYLRALKRGNEECKPADPAPAAAPASTPENKPGAAPDVERRKTPRYKCAGSVEFRTEGIDVGTWATVSDISRNGCYVEMLGTSAVDTRVDMVIEIKGTRVRAKGTVRTSHQLLGMGIEFTEIAEPDQARLDELLLGLAGGSSAPAGEMRSTQATSAVPDLPMITDPAAALNAIVKFFQSHRALSREEFAELLGQSQDRDRGARR